MLRRTASAFLAAVLLSSCVADSDPVPEEGWCIVAGGPRFKGNVPHSEGGWNERWDPAKDNYWGSIANRMPRDANQLAKRESDAEVRWGAKRATTVTSVGAGTFTAGHLDQLLQCELPARTWRLQVAFSLQGALPIGASSAAIALFAIENGVGSAKVLHYIQLSNTDLVVWADPDDGLPAVASFDIELPARTLIVSSRVLWVSDGTPADDGSHVFTTFAMAAPIFR